MKANRRRSNFLTRILTKARDFYVKGMSSLANQANFGCPPTAANITVLPKSFSVGYTTRLSASDSQEFSELMRVASKRGTLGKKIESQVIPQQKARPKIISSTVNVMPHSRSVAMARIDEDVACDFDGNCDINVNLVNFPRSRSHAVPMQRNGMF